MNRKRNITTLSEGLDDPTNCIRPGAQIIYARRQDHPCPTNPNDFLMVLARAVVVGAGTNRIDNLREFKLRDEATESTSGCTWWESLTNIYQIVPRVPVGMKLSASSISSSVDGRNATRLLCEGISEKDFSDDRKSSFRQYCEVMMLDLARLQTDQLHVKESVMLSPNIIGIDSYTLQHDGLEYRVHFHLTRNAMGSSIAIRALNCSIGDNPTKGARKLRSGNCPIRCNYCHRLYKKIYKNVWKRYQTLEKYKETGSIQHYSKNVYLTLRQIDFRLSNFSKQVHSLRHKINYQHKKLQKLTSLISKLQHGKDSINETNGNPQHGQNLAKEASSIYNVVLQKTNNLETDNLAKKYFEKKFGSDTIEFHAAMEMMKNSRRNMLSYLKNGNSQGFKYNPVCFREAIHILATIKSKQAYDSLRKMWPCLPSYRYVTKIINRNNHQPDGVLRSDIKQWMNCINKTFLNENDKKNATLGCLSVDAMTIKSGLAYNASTGKFMGIVSDGSEISQKFKSTVAKIVREAKELADIENEETYEPLVESTGSSNTGHV